MSPSAVDWDQAAWTWTVFIERQGSYLLCWWCWLKLYHCKVQNSRCFMSEMGRREADRGLPLSLKLASVLSFLRGRRCADRVAGCPEGFQWRVQQGPLDLCAMKEDGNSRIRPSSTSLCILPSISLSSSFHLILSSLLGRSCVYAVSVCQEVSVVPGGTTSFGFQDRGKLIQLQAQALSPYMSQSLTLLLNLTPMQPHSLTPTLKLNPLPASKWLQLLFRVPAPAPGAAHSRPVQKEQADPGWCLSVWNSGSA